MKRFGALAIGALIGLGVVPAHASGDYNGAAAASYADAYWSTYNSAYPSFANKGGDCTNFVSQALYAGGIAMRTSPTYSGNAAWYLIQTRRNSWSWSAPWVNAQDNSIFLPNDAGILATRVQSVYGLSPTATAPTNGSQGDVVYYDWTSDGTFDHESIITASVNGAAAWDLVDAHTNNRYHAYWTLAPYNAYWQTTTADVFHIPSTAH